MKLTRARAGDYPAERLKKCPICDSEGEFYKAASGGEMDIILSIDRCTNCGINYHNPRMTKRSMEKYYTEGIYRIFHEAQSDGERNRAVRVIRTLQEHDIHPRRSLDVGCSLGLLAQALEEQYGCEAFGYDIFPNPDAVIGVITNKDGVEGKFDLITCIHTLEHTYDPVSELAWMKEHLAEDGTLMLEVPMSQKNALPHPIMHTNKSLEIMMDRIGMNDYTIINPKGKYIGILLAHG